MRYPDSFSVTLPSALDIQVTRTFAASPQTLFDAFTKPELVRRWLLGPDGWTMPVCEIDLRVGGHFRYVWHKDGTRDMGMGGTFLEIVPSTRLVNTERFDDPWYPGQATNTTVFARNGAGTDVTITVRYASTEARDIASRSGMERGMSAGFDRLEGQLLDEEAPRITELPASTAAAIHLTIPMSAMRTAIGPALQELYGVVAAQGLQPSGPWFTHHLEMKPGVFDFEVCVPVPSPVHADGRVVSREFPARRVARTVYRGPYEGLSSAWGGLMQWIADQGQSPAADLFECYAAGPDTGASPAEWRTELSRPLL